MKQSPGEIKRIPSKTKVVHNNTQKKRPNVKDFQPVLGMQDH